MSLSFEQAIAETELLLNRSDLSEQQLSEELASLITSETGARGFFVTFLTGEWTLADQPSDGIIQLMRDFPQPSAELLIKNLVMSTAMAITHRRNNQPEYAKGSDRVQQRSFQLIQKVNSPELRSVVAAMTDGEYENFFQKWGYDQEQRLAIGEQLRACFELPI